MFRKFGVLVEISSLFVFANNSLILRRSIFLNVLLISFGIMFFAFALMTFTSYTSRLSDTIFAITPHVMIKARPELASSPSVLSPSCELICQHDKKMMSRPLDAQTESYVGLDSDVEIATSKVLESLGRETEVSPAAGAARMTRVQFDELRLTSQTADILVSDVTMLGVSPLWGQTAPELWRLLKSDDVSPISQGAIAVSESVAHDILSDDDFRTFLALGSGEFLEREVVLRTSSGAVKFQGLVEHDVALTELSDKLIITTYEKIDELDQTLAGKHGVVAVTLNDRARAETFVQELRSSLRQNKLVAVPWPDVSFDFKQVIILERILQAILITAVFLTSVSTWLGVRTIVFQRRKEIAILSIIGLPGWMITAAFGVIAICQALLASVIGVTLGAVMGVLFNTYTHSLLGTGAGFDSGVFSIDLITVGFICLITVVFTFLASVIAVLGAQSSKALDVIKGEF